MTDSTRDVQLPNSPTRCPYCHDDLAHDPWLACASCLARHHPDCWQTHDACASCGASDHLVAPDAATGVRAAPSTGDGGITTAALVVLGALALAGAFGFWLYGKLGAALAVTVVAFVLSQLFL